VFGPAVLRYAKKYQKTPTKETYKRDLQKRPVNQNRPLFGPAVLRYAKICQKRPTNETYMSNKTCVSSKTYQRDLDVQRDLYIHEDCQRDLQKRPTKET